MTNAPEPVDVTVRDNPAQHRYEAWVAGALAGWADYREVPGVEEVSMPHTQVDTSYEGQGVGSQLVQGALDDLRSKGLKVRPVCPFVKTFIERHPEYRDMEAAI